METAKNSKLFKKFIQSKNRSAIQTSPEVSQDTLTFGNGSIDTSSCSKVYGKEHNENN